jgi:beta-lactamase regulating signal transducer with metallopeptidase domain
MNANVFLPVLLELLIKSFLILAAAALLQRLLRRTSAAHQHLIWTASFAALLVLPFTKLVSPRWELKNPQMSDALATSPHIASPASELPDFAIASVEAEERQPRITIPSASTFAVYVWLGGCMGLLGYRAIGSIQLWRLKRGTRKIDDSRVTEVIRSIRGGMGMRCNIDLRVTIESGIPFTFGVWRSIVILPASYVKWSDDELFAVLRHEFGHIARHDYPIRLFADAAAALYWPNPFVWLGIRSLRRLQEQACDDLVLNAGAGANDYATLLVETARSLTFQKFVPRHAVAMARPSTLEDRVVAIVDVARRREPVGFRARLAALPLLAIALAGSALAQYESNPPNAPLEIPGVETRDAMSNLMKKAQSIIIPKIQFKDASLRESLDYLARKSRELDPEGKGVSIVLRSEPVDPKGITFTAEKISLLEALKSITAHFNLAFRVEGFAISIVPTSALQAVVLKEYQLPPGFIPDSELNKDALSKFGKADVSRYLAKLGVSPQPTPLSVYTPATQRLLMRNTLVNHDLLSTLIDDYASRRPREDVEESPRKASLVEGKLNSIILPKLQYREATARECMEHLQKWSAQCDPEKVGVKFTVHIPEGTPDARISLSLQNVPLIEALKYVTNLGNLGYRIAENEVFIAPIGDPSLKTFIRREYRLPKGAVAPDGQIQGPDGVKYGSATDFLKAFGVEFSEGTAAALTNNGTRLVIRNTPENIALTESVVARLIDADGKASPEKSKKPEETPPKGPKGTSSNWPPRLRETSDISSSANLPVFAIAINPRLQRKKPGGTTLQRWERVILLGPNQPEVPAQTVPEKGPSFRNRYKGPFTPDEFGLPKGIDYEVPKAGFRASGIRPSENFFELRSNESRLRAS